MAENYRMDSHKLIFHPERVTRWLNGDNIYPLSAEIALSSACNHRCIFCALDYMEYKPALLDKDLILSNLKEMAEKGLKSVVFAGEGEPLTNKNAPYIINNAKSMGIDVAMSTNGVLFTREISEECLESLTWIRFSVSAGSSVTYNKIHHGRQGDFDTVLKNISDAIEVKKRNNLRATVGVQLLMIPENVDEVIMLAKLLRETGVDYYTVKPYSQHPKSICSIDSTFDYRNYLDMEKKLKELSTEKFKIFFRTNSMNKKKCGRSYNKCLGLPFFTYIDANANVWPCIAFLGDMDVIYGNLKEKSFVAVWEGEQKAKVAAKFANMDITKCRELCRLDEINKYLNELRNPGEHVNFI